MNILLIGNGFDLAHGLPTQYRDFLHFGQKVEKIFSVGSNVDVNKYDREELVDWEIDNTIKNTLKDTFRQREVCEACNHEGIKYIVEITTDNDVINKVHHQLKENAWFQYFCDSATYIGQNWIDFEEEISRVIQILDETRKKILAEEDLNGIERSKANVLMRLMRASSISMASILESGQAIDDYIVRLEKDLCKLIKALEIYLTEFVEKIPVTQKVMDIMHLKIDKVLSFNYTDTYAQNYGAGRKIEYNYIHGIAKGNNTTESNNMVLGIDEYLVGEERDKDTIFIAFKKYYQRIFKMTESVYFDWLDIIREDYVVTNLYIFGHSLDVTDGDVLRKLICNDGVYTKIFYYREYKEDKRNLGKLIKNLVKVIGQDELIRRTGGEKRTIEFIPQQLPEKLRKIQYPQKRQI